MLPLLDEFGGKKEKHEREIRATCNEMLAFISFEEPRDVPTGGKLRFI